MMPMETGASSLAKLTIFCWPLFSIDLKVFLFEAGYQPVHGIGDGDGNQHHVDVHPDERAGMDLERAGAGVGRRFSSGGCARGWSCGCGRRVDMHLVELVVLILRLGAQTESRRQAANRTASGIDACRPSLARPARLGRIAAGLGRCIVMAQDRRVESENEGDISTVGA